MPSHDRVWVGKDMAVAASKLLALAGRAPDQLPRYGSERSGAMFARIVARDNLNFFRSRSEPLESRMAQALDYVDSLNAIAKIYLSARLANNVKGDELIELIGAELSAFQVELELVSEFVPTLSKDDPKYPVRMEGLNEVRQALAGNLLSQLTTLTEVQNYDVGLRARLLGYCRETFPYLVPGLTATYQERVLRRLNELSNDASFRDLHSQIILLRDEVNAAIRPEG
jgi:hypothetical protein